MEIKEDFLKDICKKAFDQDCKTLLAGFAVLSKDLSEYICIHAYACKGVTCFQEIYTTALNADRFFWNICDNNLFKTLDDAGLPTGFSEQANIEKFTLTELKKLGKEDKIWVSYPGWAMLKAFKQKYKLQLCGPNAPFNQFDTEGLSDKKELATTLAHYLLEKEFPCHTFWYPFVVYLSILMVKTEREPYCREEDDACC